MRIAYSGMIRAIPLFGSSAYATQPIYSVRITHGHRALGIVDGGTIVWFWIGDHDEYMRLLASL